jgi:hypothetical protein
MFISKANQQNVISRSTMLCKKRAQAQNVHPGEVIKLISDIGCCVDLLT